MNFIYLPALLVFLIGVGIAAVLYFIITFLSNDLSKSKAVRDSARIVALGPIAGIVIGFAVIVSVRFIELENPLILPSYLKPPYLTLFVELVILAVSVRALGVVARKLIFDLMQAKESERLLIYGIYAIAALALVYIFLSSPISPTLAAGVWSVIGFGFGIIGTYLVTYVVNLVILRYGMALASRERGLKTVMTFIRRIIIGVIVLVGVAVSTFAAFPRAGAAIASLLVAAGFGSIVIGLALQSSLSNIFAGMVISTSQPFKLNDAVLFNDEWARIEDIKLTFTILRTWDNRRLVVPNQMFLTNSLVNYDMTDPTKLCIVYITITNESDLDKAIDIMNNEALKHKDYLKVEGIPIVHVMGFDESGVNLRLLSNAKDQPTNFQMSKDLNYSIRKAFIEAGIKIAYPRRQLIMDKDVVDREIKK